MKNNRAFTLIELLVVIAIIAILAAILFPVFAQAKAAAKTAAGLSNMKQIALAQQMYYNDNDDYREGRQNVDGSVCESWKQIITPYIKSSQLFHDTMNPAALYNDIFSDPAGRAAVCPSAVQPMGSLPAIQRGYAYVNLFGSRAAGGFFDNAGLSLSQIASTATEGDVMENKGWTTDVGPFAQNWDDNVDTETSWIAGNPTTGTQYGNTGNVYGDKAENVAYLDGHAKRTAFPSMCSNIANVGVDSGPSGCHADPVTGAETGCTGPAPVWKGDANTQNFWNFSENDINGAIGSTWGTFPNAVAQFCTSMNQRNR